MRTLSSPLCLLLSLSFVALTGCSLSSTADGPSSITTSISGVAMGGNQQLGNSTIQLWAANTSGSSTTGYGAGSTSLIPGGVTADANGAFTITSTFNCPTLTSTPVYLTASGGNPGVGGVPTASPNSNIVLMAALGPCSGLSSTTHITINEVTTVAAAFALAPFLSSYSHLGTSSTNITGLTNAFTMAGNLASSDTGQSIGIGPTGIVVPTAEIYALANALASCVNSTGGTAGDTTPCGKLFTASTPTSGTAPTNTADAVIDIALHPAQNPSGVYALVTSTGPFQPTLSAAPNDFTMAVSFTLPEVANDFAADSSGNIWAVGNNALYEISPAGSVLTTLPSMSGTRIALDSSNNIWTASSANLKRMPSSLATPALYTGPGFTGASGLAVDASGNAWMAIGSTSNISVTGPTGTAIGTYADSVSHQTNLSIVPNGTVWIGSVGASYAGQLNSAGSVPSGAPFTCGTCSGSTWVANDSASYAWFGYGNVATRMSPTGAYVNYGSLSSPVGGTNSPQGVIVDGAGSAWFANSSNISNAYFGALSGFTTAGAGITPYLGFTSSTLQQPSGILVDGSGNLWLRNKQTSSGTAVPTLTVFVGAAAPTVAPLALGIKNSTLGTKP